MADRDRVPGVRAGGHDRRAALTDAQVIVVSLTEPAAFGALFERHAGAVHAFLNRRGGPQAADDLLGEVFATAFDARRRYDARVARARPWLYGIAGNLLGARLRGERRLVEAGVRAAGREVSDIWFDVDERLDAAEPAALARAVLASLPDGEREVLELVAWEGLGPAEVARVLQIPAGTARARLHRARTTLRAALTPGPTPGPTPEPTGDGPRRTSTEVPDVRS